MIIRFSKLTRIKNLSTTRQRTATTKLFVALAVLSFTTASIGRATAHDDQSHRRDDPNWSELIASMDKMHMTMGAVAPSGSSDVDFVRLMLPHHQAAIDMAKAQLLYGKDPQMRRLAQEIITDQQLEIELMQRWLNRRKQIKRPLQNPERKTKDEND
jgi:uncharacterized protein (DUF305 family)